MNALAVVAVLLVAALHTYFLVLEMFLWTRPVGRRVFGSTPEFAEATRVLAANQGLYNGFLVAGLVWSVIAGLGRSSDAVDAPGGFAIACFFLTCVIVAGVFGAVTVGRKILFVQALPAAVALLLVWLAHG